MLIENKTFNDKDKAITAASQPSVVVKNVKITACRVGSDLRANDLVDYEDVEIVGGVGRSLDKYAYGLRLGYGGRPEDANKLVRLNKVIIRDFGNASSDYSKFNRDCIANEDGNELWIKDSVLQNATDAIVDCKGSLKAKNTVFGNSHRVIRVWPKNTVILSGCNLTSAEGHALIWFRDKTSKVIIYNCTFDGQSKCPVNKITGEDMSNEDAAKMVEYTSVEPLTDSWFTGTVVTPEPKPDPVTPLPPVEKTLADRLLACAKELKAIWNLL